MKIKLVDFVDGEMIIEFNYWGSKATYNIQVPEWILRKMGRHE